MLQNGLSLFLPENDSRNTEILLLYQVVLTFIVWFSESRKLKRDLYIEIDLIEEFFS